MPNKLIDSQLSQNASTTDSISIPTSISPQLFGTLGLNTAAAGSNLSVHFSATISFSSAETVTVPATVTIFRVTDVSTLIYSATESIQLGELLIPMTISGVDNLPPNPGFLIYQAFVTIEEGFPESPVRIGPESFQAVAYSD